jgi:membrane protein implicated in regulation of membrane protease activity
VIDAIDWEILIWLLAGALSGVVELFTGTFFLVPVAAGAFAAAIVAALGGEMVWVVATFFVVALVILAVVFRYAMLSRNEPAGTHEGAGRYLGLRGSVVADIEGQTAGRVRIGTESWRAVSFDGEPIEAGGEIEVVEIRGNALVVTPR